MLKPNGYDSYFEPESEDAHDFVEQKAHELLANAFNPNNYQNMTQSQRKKFVYSLTAKTIQH